MDHTTIIQHIASYFRLPTQAVARIYWQLALQHLRTIDGHTRPYNSTVFSQVLALRCQPHTPVHQAISTAPAIRSIIHTFTPES